MNPAAWKLLPSTSVRSLPVASQRRRYLPLLPEARDIDRRLRPKAAVWEITLRCDLACRTCGSRAGARRPDELSTDEALDLVHQMADLGVLEVCLIGGEAYLRDDWTTLIREIRARGMSAILTTGGRGMTPQRARAAADAGLQSASVSIDGALESHDRLRGVSGSFRSAVQALANLRAAGVKVSVNTQVNRLSLPDLPEVLETAIAAGAHSWQVMLTAAMGRAADDPEILLQPRDLVVLFPLLARLKARCDEAGVRLWPGNNVGYFGPFETILRGQKPAGHTSGCGAGCGGIGIEADGTIKGCPSLPTSAYAGGNVREERLVDLWERSEALRFNRGRGVESLWGFCKDCYYADVCRGGCTWTAHVLFGRAGNNPYCHHRVLELERRGLSERLVRVAPAPGEPFDHGRFEIVVEPTKEEETCESSSSRAPAAQDTYG